MVLDASMTNHGMTDKLLIDQGLKNSEKIRSFEKVNLIERRGCALDKEWPR